MTSLYRLDNTVRDYAWGSRTVLASLLGHEPPGGPEAELWIGAHPGAPSRLADGTTLLEAIGADPGTHLGPHPRLPFLLKVLAVEQPLSIQVHPDPEQAVAGYLREETAGPAAGDPRRSYHDDWPKPELIYAVTPFAALCGFRPRAEAAKVLETLGGRRLLSVAALLRAEGFGPVLSRLTSWPEEDREDLVAEVVKGGADRTEAHYAWALRLADGYPGDPGVVVALLMNLVVLEPGQAMYARPRTIHAYLEGTGVEIMASSDNVLRGGLTPKHVDVAELLAVTDLAPSAPELVDPVRLPNGEDLFPTPAEQFQLTRLRPGEFGEPIEIADPGPGALLCLDGELTVVRDGRTERLGRGESLFATHAGGPLRVGGTGLAFRASVPAG